MPMRTLGIIPARGGSKGVKRKNLRLIAGRPLIHYTIDAARQSRALTHVVTTTDDAEIAAVAEAAGSAVLMRPAALAADDTPMLPVVQHALSALEPKLGRFDAVVVLQPTTLLRTSEDIDAAVELLETTRADSVISVYQVGDYHPSRMYQLVENRLVAFQPEPPARIRQGLPPLYHRNGAIYACRRDLIDEGGTLIGPDARPYLMPRERSVNIDDEFDLLTAELLVQHLRGKRTGSTPTHAHSQR